MREYDLTTQFINLVRTDDPEIDWAYFSIDDYSNTIEIYCEGENVPIVVSLDTLYKSPEEQLKDYYQTDFYKIVSSSDDSL